MPGQRRARNNNIDVWDDFSSGANYKNSPDVAYNVHGARLNVQPLAYVPPPSKKRKICDLEAPHRTWNPMEDDGEDDFNFPESQDQWTGESEEVLCDKPSRKRTAGVSCRVLGYRSSLTLDAG